MKRKICMLLLLVSAVIAVCGFRKNEDKVYDYAGLFTKDEKASLQEDCIKLADQLELDVVVLSIDDAEGKSSETYANDFYDSRNFGYEGNRGSGILLLYDMDNRMVYLDTAGDAQKLITDDEVEEILDEVMKYFPGDPYKSTQVFFEAAHGRAVNSWVANNIEGYYNEEKGMYITEGSSRRGSYWQRITRPAALLRSFLIAAAAAGITVLCMLLSCRTGHTGGVNAYQKGPAKVNARTDRFVHTTVTKRRIETDSGSGGGGGGGYSSTHTSSSGSSHGGGGRSF